jgi:hypothetical protein
MIVIGGFVACEVLKAATRFIGVKHC